ncbi:MAG: hypothetical protein H0W25_04725, partial [Acidimicrobiia bacterium]|nr:hypothetical protein [Acidimicrobiia bacterium]
MKARRSGLIRATLVALLLYAAAVGTLLVEVQLARSGPRLADERLELDGRIGPPTGAALRVVWLGDSTAAGVGASGPDAAVPRA